MNLILRNLYALFLGFLLASVGYTVDTSEFWFWSLSIICLVVLRDFIPEGETK